VDGVWVDANASAHVGTVAADDLVGTSNDDLFPFAAGTLSLLGEDTINGDDGNDALIFGSTVNLINDDAFENFTNVEKITLFDGANLLNLGINTDAAGITTVVGGTGNDTIDGSLSEKNLELIGGEGNDSLVSSSKDNILIGGSGDDTYVFNAQELDLNDAVEEAEDDGNDLLTFSTGGDIYGGRRGGLSGVTGVETIQMSAAGNKLLIGEGDAIGLSLIRGGTGDDYIDASTRSGLGLTFEMGTGDDTVNGTQGQDIFRFAINELTGKDSITDDQIGDDILEFTTNGTIGDEDLQLLDGSKIATLKLSNTGTNNVQLGARSNGTFDTVLGGSASDNIDLSGRDSSTSLKSGSGSDKITLDEDSDKIVQIRTQSGADTIVVSAVALTSATAIGSMYGGSNDDTLSLSDALNTGLDETMGGGQIFTIKQDLVSTILKISTLKSFIMTKPR